MQFFYSALYYLFMRMGWVIAFVLLCLAFYENGLRNRQELYKNLYSQQIYWQTEKQLALEEQKELELQINSQSDLAWIELTLMKGLGLMPEDQQKVYFHPIDESAAL